MTIEYNDPIDTNSETTEKIEINDNHKKEKRKKSEKGTTPRVKTVSDNEADSCLLDHEDINPNQSKYTPVFRGRMRPDPGISHHPAFDMLMQYAMEGCPVDCGEPWTREHLEAAVERGPHMLATLPEAAAALQNEAMEKVDQGFAKIYNWDDIKGNPHPNLKISPLVAVPHKSPLFRAILDLSYCLRLHGIYLPSVNEATLPLSDHKAMEQMGNVLKRLITTVAGTKQSHGPIVFAKWDIKDGFW